MRFESGRGLQEVFAYRRQPLHLQAGPPRDDRQGTLGSPSPLPFLHVYFLFRTVLRLPVRLSRSLKRGPRVALGAGVGSR